MARPRKRINNTPFPDYVIDSVARTFYPNLLEDWQKENMAKEFNDNIPTVLQHQNSADNLHQEINISNIA